MPSALSARPHSSAADRGLLLVGHGSRESSGTDEFLATAKSVASIAGELAVEPCFLEFAQPTIAQGFVALAGRGCKRIVVVPLFLFSAGHIQYDIPSAVAEVADRFPDVLVTQGEHLGCHPALIELSQARYDQTLASRPLVSVGDTALVMVGRGSHDEQATAEMLQFVELRRQQTTAAHTFACFVAMAEPKLEQVLDQVVQLAPQRVVVQPHLLFGGVLLDRIVEKVARYAAKQSQIEWLVSQHLGVSNLLAAALLDRASAALDRVK